MPMMGWYGTGWPMALIMAMNVVLWGGLGALVAWMVVRVMRRQPASQTHEHDAALDVLQRRYACGEIDTHTFDEMQAHLLAATQSQERPAPVEH